MSGAVRLGEPFFLRHTLVMLLLVAAGFLGNALAAGVPPPSALVVVHAALSSAWYLLSCLQPWLVRRGAQRAHVRFGWASVVIALGVLVSGVWVAAEHFRDQPVRDARAAMLLFFNLLNILQFFALYCAAVGAVRHPAAHKRLVVLAGVVMTPPALVRLTRTLGWGEAASLIFLFGLLFAVVVHDRRSLGRVHKATWWGLVVVAVGIAAGGPIAFSEWWADLASSAFG